MTEARIVIIGYGNDLRGDDALGPMVAAQLEEMLAGRDDIRVEACQGLTPDLSLPLSWAQLVVFVDCSIAGPTGQVVRREVGPSNDARISMVHFLDPSALLTWTLNLYGRAPKAVTLTVAGETFEITQTLSPSVQAAVPKLIEQVMAEIGAVQHA